MATPRHGDGAFVRRCASVPLQLSPAERRLLGTLVAALRVSEYTDDVDTLSRRNRAGRVVAAIRDVCAVAAGLTVCANAGKGKQLGDDPAEHEAFFQHLFELGRRVQRKGAKERRSATPQGALARPAGRLLCRRLSTSRAARRHKIMNPARMRGEYGKMMCVLQDAANRGARDALGFSRQAASATPAGGVGGGARESTAESRAAESRAVS